MGDVVVLADYLNAKKEMAASAAISGDLDDFDHEDEVEEIEDDLLRIAFRGTSDEILVQVTDWLRSEARCLGDIITVRRGGCLEFEDFPNDGDWINRPDPNNDVIWEETLPMYDLKYDGDVAYPFEADTLLGIIERNAGAFRSLLEQETYSFDERKNAFLADYYRY